MLSWTFRLLGTIPEYGAIGGVNGEVQRATLDILNSSRYPLNVFVSPVFIAPIAIVVDGALIEPDAVVVPSSTPLMNKYHEGPCLTTAT